MNRVCPSTVLIKCTKFHKHACGGFLGILLKRLNWTPTHTHTNDAISPSQVAGGDNNSTPSTGPFMITMGVFIFGKNHLTFIFRKMFREKNCICLLFRHYRNMLILLLDKKYDLNKPLINMYNYLNRIRLFLKISSIFVCKNCSNIRGKR